MSKLTKSKIAEIYNEILDLDGDEQDEEFQMIHQARKDEEIMAKEK